MGKMHDLFDGSDAADLTEADCANNKALEAWDEIMKIAIEHALVVAAYDGVATLALPEAQKENGWLERCQYNHMLGAHPKTLERRKLETPNVELTGAARLYRAASSD